MVAAGVLGFTGGRAPCGPLDAQIGISDPRNHKGIVLLERQRSAKVRTCFLDIRDGLLGRVDRALITSA
jgi:hypothetical protein